MQNNCLLIGAGYMATEYIKVLKKLEVDFLVVGRGEEKINELKKAFDISAVSGGLLNYVQEYAGKIPENAIVAVSIEELVPTTLKLIQMGVKNILVEKPVGLNLNEVEEIITNSKQHNAHVFVAYNRRFYASVIELKKKIEAEGGIISVNFEFTEWVHTIDTNKFSENVLNKFIIANSSHVIDTVFYLAGRPKSLDAQVSGSAVQWHSSGSIFMGNGVTENNIPFSYSSNWDSAGRWAIEILTTNNRYYLKPLEQLHVQAKGSVAVNGTNTDYTNDLDYKPGVLKMVQSFLGKDKSDICSIEEHLKNFKFYNKIGGY